MARPRKEEGERTTQVSFRMPEAMAKQFDEIAAKMGASMGITVSRTAVVLKALREWLDKETHKKSR